MRLKPLHDALEHARAEALAARVEHDQVHAARVQAASGAVARAEIAHGAELSEASRKALEAAQRSLEDARCRGRFLAEQAASTQSAVFAAESAFNVGVRTNDEAPGGWSVTNRSKFARGETRFSRLGELLEWIDRPVDAFLPVCRITLARRGVVLEVRGANASDVVAGLGCAAFAWRAGPDGCRVAVLFSRPCDSEAHFARAVEHAASLVRGEVVIERVADGFVAPNLRRADFRFDGGCSPRDTIDLREIEALYRARGGEPLVVSSRRDPFALLDVDDLPEAYEQPIASIGTGTSRPSTSKNHASRRPRGMPTNQTEAEIL